MNKHPNASVFHVPNHSAEMLQKDLKLAKIPPMDESGCVVDFHALRHTMGTWLGANGVPLGTIKELMRHSDISLTMRYAHATLQQQKDAIEGLPSLSLSKSVAKTGS